MTDTIIPRMVAAKTSYHELDNDLKAVEKRVATPEARMREARRVALDAPRRRDAVARSLRSRFGYDAHAQRWLHPRFVPQEEDPECQPWIECNESFLTWAGICQGIAMITHPRSTDAWARRVLQLRAHMLRETPPQMAGEIMETLADSTPGDNALADFSGMILAKTSLIHNQRLGIAMEAIAHDDGLPSPQVALHQEMPPAAWGAWQGRDELDGLAQLRTRAARNLETAGEAAQFGPPADAEAEAQAWGEAERRRLEHNRITPEIADLIESAALSDKQREVMRLLYIGYEQHEVAEQLDIPLGSVGRIRNEAVVKMRLLTRQ